MKSQFGLCLAKRGDREYFGVVSEAATPLTVCLGLDIYPDGY
jgi:hypothetical protein